VATLPKGTPLFVEGELVYERYPRKVEATIGKKTTEVEVMTTVPKIKVQRLIRLESSTEAPGESEGTEEAL
jgi:single-stranded DNA-binding protein